jgi:hypothetical protein
LPARCSTTSGVCILNALEKIGSVVVEPNRLSMLLCGTRVILAGPDQDRVTFGVRSH